MATSTTFSGIGNAILPERAKIPVKGRRERGEFGVTAYKQKLCSRGLADGLRALEIQNKENSQSDDL